MVAIYKTISYIYIYIYTHIQLSAPARDSTDPCLALCLFASRAGTAAFILSRFLVGLQRRQSGKTQVLAGRKNMEILWKFWCRSEINHDFPDLCRSMRCFWLAHCQCPHDTKVYWFLPYRYRKNIRLVYTYDISLVTIKYLWILLHMSSHPEPKWNQCYSGTNGADYPRFPDGIFWFLVSMWLIPDQKVQVHCTQTLQSIRSKPGVLP